MANSAARESGRRLMLLALPVLLALSLVRLWLMPLPSSFWLDEMATVFVARHGANHPSLAAAAPQAWRSWYYPVIRLDGALFGYSEVAVRMPSVLAMAGFLGLFAALVRRLANAQAAWFAVFACLALPGLNYQAANARPYALGMCAFAAALLFEVRWLDSARWRDALPFAACAALVLYIHLLFWPSCLVFVLYAAARVAAGETPVNGSRAVLVFALWACALLPVAAQTLSLLGEARAHVIAPLPSLAQFLRSLELTLVLGSLAGAWLIARVWPLAAGHPEASCLNDGSHRRMVAVPADSPLRVFLAHRRRGLRPALPATGAARRGARLYRPGGPVHSRRRVAADLGRIRHRRPSFSRALASKGAPALAAPPQFRLAGGRPRRQPTRIRRRDPRRLPQSVHRGPAARLASRLPAARIPVRPPLGLSHIGQNLPVSIREFRRKPNPGPPLSPKARFPPPRRFLIYGWGPQVSFWRDWFAHRPEFAGLASAADGTLRRRGRRPVRSG